jgi:hypothetical protein
MLTEENDVEIRALHTRGWNQSAISRHTGRDRKTVRKYLAAAEVPARERAASCLEPFRGYIVARFVDDPHLPAVTLLDELTAAGFDRSYPTLVRELRATELRPVCLVCQQRRGNAPTTEIDHPAGEEPAYVLVGALSHSGRFRAVFCEQMTFGHLAGALHEILAGLGGTSLVWRVDRMATAVIPAHRPAEPVRAARQALRRRRRDLPGAPPAAQGGRRGSDQVHRRTVVADRERQLDARRSAVSRRVQHPCL